MEMKKEGEKHAVQMAGLKSELDTLKGLLRTYETSNQRKDEVFVLIGFLYVTVCEKWIVTENNKTHFTSVMMQFIAPR